MRMLVILVAMLTVLTWPTMLAVMSHTATQLNSPQIAGDVGPGGG